MIEVICGPDSMGRYIYWKYWHVSNPPYCLTCGADALRNCDCYGQVTTRSQVFRGRLEER